MATWLVKVSLIALFYMSIIFEMSMWKKIASQLSMDITIEKTSLQESEWKELKVCAYLSPPSSNNYTLHVCFAKCLSSSWLCVHWCFLCLNYRLDQTCLSVDFYSLYRTWYQLFHQRMKPLQLILPSPLMNRGSYSSIKHGILMEPFRIFLRIQFKCLMEVVLMPHGQA